ncbi:MAG TPA: L,D-transpeptidase [Pyrinomonadaceae bacterium]
MHSRGAALASLLLGFALCAAAPTRAQTTANAANWERFESARSDKFTGGRIERTRLEPGQTDIRITVNVPSFRLTLWQNGMEVKTYPIGVGLKEFPLVIGDRLAKEIIYNPSWIPPDSDWVTEMSGVSAGEVIKASDKRNPLGKVKIPLGGGYLIHQAKGVGDLGRLVSHGCVRMLRSDLYDLAEKIIAARSLPVTPRKIAQAKASLREMWVNLDAPLPVDIDYDTEVVEEGVLHLYPDVYGRKTATLERLRAELEASGVDTSSVGERTLQRMLARVTPRTQFVVSIESIKQGRALTQGRILPLVGQPRAKPAPRRRRAAPNA